AAGIITVVTGGNVLPGTNVLAGDLAIKALSGIHFTKVILGISGASFSHGFTCETVEEALIYKQLFAISNEIIVVADHTKFGPIGFAHLCQLEEVHKVVSNKEMDNKFKEFFFQNKIKVYTPYEVEELVSL
ncbi:MAG TPA: DeoR/GlpR transcriptional regulator, partial [Bacillota bacterium]|nr:DeoR/GlpR transcriptional regulator [Bacillota bacterium]